MDLRSQTSLIAATLCLALALSVLLRAQRRSTHWWFGLFAINFAAWYATRFALGIGGQPELWERINLTWGVLLPLSAVRFFGFLVGEHSRRMRLLNRSAVASAAVILATIATPYYEHWIVATAIFLYVFVFVFAALLTMYRSGDDATSRLEGARLRYVAIVGAAGGLFTLLEYLPYVGLDIPPVGAVFILVFLYALSQSILRFRLLDMYELAGRLGVLTALAFMLAALLWILMEVSGDQFFLHGVVSAFVVLVLFDPVRTRVQEWISQFFFHERFALEQRVQQLRRAVSHIFDIEDLAREVMTSLGESPRITHAALYLAGPDNRAYLLRGHSGQRPAERVAIAPARPLIDRLTRHGTLTLETIELELEERRQRGDDRDAETLHDIHVTLDALQASVCLGILGDGGGLYGFLTLRDERLRDAFSPEEIQLFAGLAAQIAVAVENSELFQQMNDRDRLAALGEMAAGLAHEIRNPLGSIKASAQYLAEAKPSNANASPDDEFLNIIVDEVDRLNRVVGSFLDYARPGQPDPEPIFVNAAVEKTLQLLRPECDSFNINLHVALDPDVPNVRIDVERLRQVLINLVQNAVQAMPEGGDLFVETRVRDRMRIGGGSDSWVVILVRDTGPGIAEELLSNVFVPFVTTKQQGTGLGLAISQRIVTGAGGRINVRSRIGNGTTFEVSLPGVGTEQRQSSTGAASEPGASTETVLATNR